MRLPRWMGSIRFRLSLAYALAVFAAGSVLVLGLYLWQVSTLNEPILMVERQLLVSSDSNGGETVTPINVVAQDSLTRTFLLAFEHDARRVALLQWRKGSLAGLGVLVFVAFGSGWMLSGMALRPVGRMVTVAREIGGGDLSQRISLKGVDDELKGLADTFDTMMDRLQESVETRRRFVQDMSHELRNPLAVAQANLELAITDPEAGQEQLKEAAAVAHRSTERIARIVDDLVNQARAEMPAGVRSVVDLGEVVATTAQDMEASAVKRSITLRVQSEGSLRVRADKAALARALSNLVINAIRLAPTGSVVSIGLTVAGDEALISVSDEGPGIAPQNQERIFERFWQGEGQEGGLGLGLSIVRQVAEAHGGRVFLDSKLGAGSTFTIALPMRSEVFKTD